MVELINNLKMFTKYYITLWLWCLLGVMYWVSWVSILLAELLSLLNYLVQMKSPSSEQIDDVFTVRIDVSLFSNF